MKSTPKCAVLIPIYKNQLDEDEIFSVKTSLSNLKGHETYWVAPVGIDLSFYDQSFDSIEVKHFDDKYFDSINGYNKLLTSNFFYETFLEYEFSLVCQPDAVVLKPELNNWLEKPFDYIGAPWPNGYSLKIHTNKLSLPDGITCTTFVGNGGLSLRRNKACIELLNEFPDVAANWREFGHAEDLFYSFLSNISSNFRVPNLITAANFSHDIEPIYLQKLINGKVPFGVHAWSKYEKEYWQTKEYWPKSAVKN